VRDVLERDGFAVRATASGAEAICSFGADPPDVLVLDIALPDADGRDVCQALARAASPRRCCS
jgi:DNA-binding response OmpR family regulator